jgi:hypothetical protein
MTNSNYRVDIVSIEANDTKGITDIQSKINQWITKGELAKYEIHTTASHIIFNICRKKTEASAPKSKTAKEELAPF